jgi:hypothetical protein
VAANPNNGFSYGYFYYIPRNIKNNIYLLVEPNNGRAHTNDSMIYYDYARNIINGKKTWADELGVVVLVPVFPRPELSGGPYTYDFNRDTLKTNIGDLARIDLQLIKMIDDFKDLCLSNSISIKPKFLFFGYSASGAFANRFTALHPDLVQAVASGGLCYRPILPATIWNGETLIYPVGIADIGTIAGIQFNLEIYKTVPQFIFEGAEDTNDDLFPEGITDSERKRERDIVIKVQGLDMQSRWEPSIAIYKAQGLNVVTFIKYPGVGHTYWTDEIVADIISFLKSNIK